jgi:hypothetical protein
MASPFVPNLGQWQHRAKFVHRSGPMTLFLEDRGWVVHLVERPVEPKAGPHAGRRAILDDRNVDEKIHGVALRMTFAGDAHVPEIVGEKKLPCHHNYFLGDDENRWRTGVPLYSSVRYENLYAGIDLRLREANGVPEYDLLLQPGADLSRVIVHVEGAKSLSVVADGSLVIETELGPLSQPMPKTWQLDADGRKREVACNFTLLGADRFGFAAPDWDKETNLTIDPGLIWSTLLGGSAKDFVNGLSVNGSGVVTVAGETRSINFPSTRGAYDTTYNKGGAFGGDAFVSRLDPSKNGSPQLVYSTFLGGSGNDRASALSVDANGVVTVTGDTASANFPTTSNAYDRTFGVRYGFPDAFVCRLDPRGRGSAQLVYSTFLGARESDVAVAISVDVRGVVTVAGNTNAPGFPTTRGAYDATYNGGAPAYYQDAFVSLLDPTKIGRAQLLYSTFLGGANHDSATALAVDARGVVTVVGYSQSPGFPTTRGAYDTTHNGGTTRGSDAFVSRLDPSKAGAAQLVYSTFLGAGADDLATALSVDAFGLATVTGHTSSSKFPTTRGAFDSTYNSGTSRGSDAFVSRLDPSKAGAAQLVYSTFLGGSGLNYAPALSVDGDGEITVAGITWSTNFPTSTGAYDTTQNGGYDGFVSRLDPTRSGSAQLVYSTYLGGSGWDHVRALSVDASGVVTVAGYSSSPKFPTTGGAYDTTHNGSYVGFVSRLEMGVALYADVHEFSIKVGGTQGLSINAGKAHANRSYWIFGSVTGTRPGVNLLGVHIPLNPDLYTNVAMANVNTTVFTKFRGTLDANGLATASFVVPPNLPLPTGFTFHHAYVVYDASGKFYMASNAVPLRLR